MPFRALVVDTDREALSATEQLLEPAGYLVACASTFEEAKRRLEFAPPDLLVTAARLGAFNGLHLALRAHSDFPRMAVIVVDDHRDVVLEAEATKMAAAYVARPFNGNDLINLVKKVLEGLSERPSSVVERRWPRKLAEVSANAGGAVVKVVDVSYGGLRLQLSGLPDDGLSPFSTVSLPSVGPLPIHHVWARGGVGTPPVWWCGVEVKLTGHRTSKAWRKFVDSLD
jgi:DNA-binding response OmpR family regulator